MDDLADIDDLINGDDLPDIDDTSCDDTCLLRRAQHLYCAHGLMTCQECGHTYDGNAQCTHDHGDSLANVFHNTPKRPKQETDMTIE